MKKLIPLILLLAVMLSGCKLNDSIAEIKERFINPAVEKAKTGNVGSANEKTAVISEFNIITDRSKLTPFTAPEIVGKRLSPEYISEFVQTSSYEKLIPFISSWIYGTEGSLLGTKYGLISIDGTVVLDGVLSAVNPLQIIGADGKPIKLGILELVKYDAETGTKKSAICSESGAWITGFDFEKVIPMSKGALCISNSKDNLAKCYSRDGKVLFDTADFQIRAALAPDSVSDLAIEGNDFMKIKYSNGQHGYIDATGIILNLGAEFPAYHTDNRAFTEGIGVICIGDSWRYMKTDGTYAFDKFFQEAHSFVGGIAVAREEGTLYIIDTQGEPLKAFPGVTELKIYPNYIYADGQYLNRSTFEHMQVNGINAAPYRDGFWAKAENGIYAQAQGTDPVFLSGAKDLLDGSGGLFLVKLEDDSTAVLDKDSRAVAAGGDLKFVTDAANDSVYVISGKKLLSSEGKLLADGLFVKDGEPVIAPFSGLGFCSEIGRAPV